MLYFSEIVLYEYSVVSGQKPTLTTNLSFNINIAFSSFFIFSMLSFILSWSSKVLIITLFANKLF